MGFIRQSASIPTISAVHDMRAITAVQPAWGAEVHTALDALLHDALVVRVAGIAFGGVDGNVDEVIVDHVIFVCHGRGF